jgi:hypothetical protein
MIRKRSPIPTSPHLLVEAASTPSLTSAATTMFTVGDGKGGCPDRQGWLRAGCLVGKPLEKASSLYSSGGRVVGKPATEDVPAKLLASAGVEEPYRVTQRNSAWAGRVLLPPWPAEPDRHLVLKQRPDWSVVIAQVGRGVDDQGKHQFWRCRPGACLLSAPAEEAQRLLGCDPRLWSGRRRNQPKALVWIDAIVGDPSWLKMAWHRGLASSPRAGSAGRGGPS